jgi:hypothetical protein
VIGTCYCKLGRRGPWAKANLNPLRQGCGDPPGSLARGWLAGSPWRAHTLARGPHGGVGRRVVNLKKCKPISVIGGAGNNAARLAL